MSVNIKYNGSSIANITENVTKTLKTSGKYCEADIVVENTQDGGGGSLPTSITKIDGGSFTVSSDTSVRGYLIPHNLGVAPKGYRIWCPEMFNDLNDQTQSSLLFLFVISDIDLRWGNKTANGYCNGMTRDQTGGCAKQPNTDINTGWYSESHIGIPSDSNQYYYYLAGKTYQWLAWA